jgi:hypothetical protein
MADLLPDLRTSEEGWHRAANFARSLEANPRTRPDLRYKSPTGTTSDGSENVVDVEDFPLERTEGPGNAVECCCSWTPYVFDRLEGSDSIRLLYLKPALSPCARLEATFESVHLENKLSYEALSYTWGEADFAHVLYITRDALRISSNLNAALKRLRLPHRERILWIDAVCIDQSNGDERGQQVALMAQIYSESRRVICWLGQGNNETNRAMSFLSMLGQHAEYEQTFDSAGVLQPLELNASAEELSEIGDQARDAVVGAIYTLPWFTRLWIIQEVSLAPLAIVCCGYDFMTWETFAIATRVLEAVMIQTGWSVAPLQPFQMALKVVEIRIRRNFLSDPTIMVGSPYNEFGVFLEMTKSHVCKEPHDHVYALLGFKPEDCVIDMEPDYRKLAEDVFAAFAQQILRHGDLTVMYYAGMGRRNPSPTGAVHCSEASYLPSWAPEFRQDLTHDYPIPWSSTWFHASTVPPTIEFERLQPKKMFIGGLIVDEIEFLVQHNATEDVHFDIMRNVLIAFKATYEVVVPNRTNKLTIKNMQSAFAQLLMVDGSCPEAKKHIPNSTPENLLRLWSLYEEQCLSGEGEISVKLKDTDCRTKEEYIQSLSPGSQEMFHYFLALLKVWSKCSLAVTKLGYIGVVPSSSTRHTDWIAILDGSHMPSLLRKVDDSDDYQFVGSCYVYGVMYGETAHLNGWQRISLV